MTIRKMFYIAEGRNERGPYTIQELINLRITKNTLVWFEGMDDWKEAKEIEELKEIIISAPPPIPINVVNIHTEVHTTVDRNHFYLFLVGLGLVFYNIYILNFWQLYNQNTIVIFSLIIRILVVMLSVDAAKKQNRSAWQWGIYTFFFPPLAMIIQGLLFDKPKK